MEQRPPNKDLPERLLKYLPALMFGHLFITIPAFVISLALAYATFVQADATHKIQQSETWPYVSYGTSNTNEGKPEISFNLTNGGVGPAKLVAMQFAYKGKPMNSPREFLRSCCAGTRPLSFMSSPVNGVLRPGERRDFIRLARDESNTDIWDKLEAERWNVVVQSCYCSIFDDCWVLDSGKNDPQPVDSCPANWTRFEERPNSARPKA